MFHSEVKKALSLVLSVSLIGTLLIPACGPSAQSIRTRNTLEAIRNQFAPLEQEDGSIEPLESVQVPPREQPDSSTSFSQRILAGQSAPFSGLLLSDSAAAFVASEYEAIIQRYELALSQQRAMDLARVIRDSRAYRLQINSERERFRIFAESQERYIASLEASLSQQNQVDVLQIFALVGAGAVGIVFGIIIGIFLAN
jgi:hypothetical protein